MKGKEKILIVDDQAGVRLLIAETLKEDNYEVKMAANGKEALVVLKEFEPSVVLLDMKMPGMSGLEVLQEMKRFSLDVPVILMSAYGEQEMVGQAKRQGVVYFLNKPFDINELRRMVADVLTSQFDIKAHA